jgi:Cu-Zn family superoxide dismutase
MGKLIAVSSIFLLLSAGSACKKDEDKKATPEPTPTTPTEVVPAEATIDAAPEAAAVKSATATIAPASESKVAGTVTFTKSADSIKVEAKLTGLTPGDHGFHVHEKGDCSSPDAKSAGGHFNPGGVDHGAPGGEAHHTGDLGNIVADKDGVAEMSADLLITHLSLDADAVNNIVGKAVIVHGGADDMKSQPSGNAGPRVGCGVIKLVEAAE